MKWVISAHTITTALLILAHSPLPLSLTRNLIVGPSCHCRSKLYHSLAQALSLLVCSILFKIIYIYIYIVFSLRCLFHMNPICRAKVRGITWHHCQVPKPSLICRAKVCFLFFFPKTHQFLFCWFILFLYPNRVPVFIKEGVCWLILWVLSACF